MENGKEGFEQLKFNSDGTLILPRTIQKDLQIEQKQKEEFLDIWEDFESDDSQYHLNDNVEGFNLYDGGDRLDSLKFSNNETQASVVNNVVNNIRNGKKVIFIKGVCGTGKSAIALNIAKELGSASVVVPGKALQKQYFEDYSKNKYVLKKDHKKLKIKVITGRENHKCKYKLGCNANHADLPCKIEINEKNKDKIQEYLKLNNKVSNDLDIKDVRRMSIAPVCPFWSPTVPEHVDLHLKADLQSYQGLQGVKYNIYSRQQGCSYYEQFKSYKNGEVIVFNSAKYLLETFMGRKPNTKVEIIDECDEFLDSFASIKTINLNRFVRALINFIPENEKHVHLSKNLINLVESMVESNRVKELVYNKGIVKLVESPLANIFDVILQNQGLFDEADEESYCHNVYELTSMFEDFLNETYLQFRQTDRGLVVDLVMVNIKETFKELIDKNNAIVLMSGTIHSDQVLRRIFGLEDFVVINAEDINQGSIKTIHTDKEIDCRYSNFAQGNVTRESYLRALDKAVEDSIKPTLVHVNSFDDLPSEDEKYSLNLSNLMTKEKLIETQRSDPLNNQVKNFKEGLTNVLFSTKCSRGVDFPGSQCNSIVFTKFPNPNSSSVFWKILKQTYPTHYWSFYNDKAKREFLQKLFRGVRSKEDHVNILSPDKRVLDFVNQLKMSNEL